MEHTLSIHANPEVAEAIAKMKAENTRNIGTPPNPENFVIVQMKNGKPLELHKSRLSHRFDADGTMHLSLKPSLPGYRHIGIRNKKWGSWADFAIAVEAGEVHNPTHAAKFLPKANGQYGNV